MGKVKSFIDKVEVAVVKKALDKGRYIDEKYSWTIYFLIDLKVVYIITFAYITIVNLISSTANGEAISDAHGMMLFNVTLSPEQRDVEVNSINDAVLWNCRNQSVTSYYYRFLYWMLIVALCAGLFGFWVTKFIGLISVNSTCTTCSCPCVFDEHGLTKLWHIAVLEQLKNGINPSQGPPQQPFTGSEITSAEDGGNNQQSQGDRDPQRCNVIQVDIENTVNSNVAGNESTGSHDSDHETSVNTSSNAPEIETDVPQPSTTHSSTASRSESSKFELKYYKALLLNKDMPSSISKELCCRLQCMNCCRQIIPGILLCLSVIILGLSYLSYDLHPLACVVIPAEEFIHYNATTKRVYLEFSDNLHTFQKAAGFTVLGLAIIFLILVYLFYRLSEKVIAAVKPQVLVEIHKAQNRSEH